MAARSGHQPHGRGPKSGVKTRPQRVYLLADRKPLDVTQNESGAFVVQLPAAAPSSIDAVLVLEGVR